AVRKSWVFSGVWSVIYGPCGNRPRIYARKRESAIFLRRSAQEPCRFQCKIGEHAAGARPLERSEAFQHRRLAVEGARPSGELDHRVLAGDLVGEDGDVEIVSDRPDDIEIGQARLHHDAVRAFVQILLDL